MVANGYGYSLANIRPRSDMALDGRRVVRVDIEGEHRPMVIGVATLEVPRKSKLLDAFVSHCEAFVTDQHVPGMEAPASGGFVRQAV
jgi:FAD synthase